MILCLSKILFFQSSLQDSLSEVTMLYKNWCIPENMENTIGYYHPKISLNLQMQFEFVECCCCRYLI